jgi:hypothetical protein
LSKYGNQKTNGYASKKEAKRAFDLKLMERAGLISQYREQVRFELVTKQEGEQALYYVADFVYRDKDGKAVVEDAKGMRTQAYIIKRKLMKFIHGITILET